MNYDSCTAYNAMGQAPAGRGETLGDIDDDVLLDFLVSHLGIEHQWPGAGWGIFLSDFDHDGRLDCAVVNGRVNRGPPANDTLVLGPGMSGWFLDIAKPSVTRD